MSSENQDENARVGGCLRQRRMEAVGGRRQGGSAPPPPTVSNPIRSCRPSNRPSALAGGPTRWPASSMKRSSPAAADPDLRAVTIFEELLRRHPNRSDSALTLKVLPPVTTAFSLVERMR